MTDLRHGYIAQQFPIGGLLLVAGIFAIRIIKLLIFTVLAGG
ncbi:hypothetical protein [Methylocystis sp. B8]|nr:hypothetical protein [Methylocystis sp. B8]